MAKKDICIVTLTGGNIRNKSIRVTGLDNFFPPDSYGKSSREEGEGCYLCLRVAGLDEEVFTDIDGHKNIFRRRDWVREFIEIHGLSAGDRVNIEKISPYEYRVYPVR